MTETHLPVEVSLQTQSNSNGTANFAITFRAPLPEGLQINSSSGPVDGKDCDLSLTLRVSVDWRRVESDERNDDPFSLMIGDPRMELRC